MPVARQYLEGKLFRCEELAQLSGFHIDSIRRLIRQGKLKATKPPHSRAYFVRGEDFWDYLKGEVKED